MRRFFTLGFTMIELMITLAIVAVLAAAVMAALNPIEQTDRARDAKMFSAGVDVVKAIERYNTLTDSYPFTDSDDFYVGGSHVAPILNTLVTQEQLSQGLADYVADNVMSFGVHIFKPSAGLGAPVYMCFTPRSIQRQADVNNNGQICGPETVDTVAAIPNCSTDLVGVCLGNSLPCSGTEHSPTDCGSDSRCCVW